ncbi:uncharacterized protein N7518_009722 [Penicillium psychrosexuale]|uniref:uncharacterized protein n=1 Tax=Penicillium psychrosexuale TaxID=1002107 RepID=UPI002545093A|nr:uncharacterized protein N7518_009722 [Penicillium psychrosexuale]KAJ5784045.1 hypothetical protein N7518_009722 [Penicillium psychrosexuale]
MKSRWINYGIGFSSVGPFLHMVRSLITSPSHFVLSIKPLPSILSHVAKQRLQYVRDFDSNQQDDAFTKLVNKAIHNGRHTPSSAN